MPEEQPDTVLDLLLPRDTRWLGEIYGIKTKAALNSQEKLLLVGGSAVHFGFSASTIGSNIGVRSVNYGTHGGLSADYILHRALGVIGAGDTVLLALSWHQLQVEQFFTETQARHIGINDRNYLDGLAPSLIEKVKAAVRRERLMEISDLNGPAWTGPLYDSRSVSDVGDETANDPGNGFGGTFGAAPKFGPISRDAVSNKSPFLLVRAFSQKAKERGARVIAAIPPMLTQDVYHDASSYHWQLFEGCISEFREAQIETLGKPTDYLFVEDEMLDHIYHANKLGTARMTAVLLSHLRRAL